MDNTEKYAVVPVLDNRPPSDAIIWGSIGECMEFVAQSVARAEAEQRIASAQQQLKTDAKVLAQAQKLTADAIPKITAMADAFVSAREKQARKDAAAKKRAEETAEAQRIEELLLSMPDPDDPNAISPDDGDLQSPKRPADKEHLKPTNGLTGSFPTRLEKEAPRGGPYQEPDIKNLAHPQTPPQQPVAISLNAE